MEEIIVVAICLLLNAVFAAFEMAFVSVPKPHLKSLARAGNKYAQTLFHLRENPERTLSVIQIGITLVGAVAAAVGGAGASDRIEPLLQTKLGVSEVTAEILAVVLVVLPITFLNVVVGELVPKTLALRNPAKIVLAGAKWLFIADRVLTPIIHVLEWSTKKILQLFFMKSKAAEPLAQTSIDIDTFSPIHQRFILNMVDIEKKKIRDIILPWSQVIVVKRTDSVAHVTQTVLNSGHTRLPVIDDEDRVTGILHTKEYLTFKESGENQWQGLIRPFLQIRLDDPALGVLRLMQEKRSHMAIVLSPAGVRLGIVTLEDILEEIVGDIFDEDDDGKVRRVLAYKTRSRLFGKPTP